LSCPFSTSPIQLITTRTWRGTIAVPLLVGDVFEPVEVSHRGIGRFVAAGVIIPFTGDKVVRPILIGTSTQLGFVWVLMGTLGGLEFLGFIGIFVGPAVLSLAGELWRERTRKVERDHTPHAKSETPPRSAAETRERALTT
jgi:hypothetical protein